MLAWQINRIVREVESDFIKREIGVLDMLCVDDVVVAVIADERC